MNYVKLEKELFRYPKDKVPKGFLVVPKGELISPSLDSLEWKVIPNMVISINFLRREHLEKCIKNKAKRSGLKKEDKLKEAKQKVLRECKSDIYEAPINPTPVYPAGFIGKRMKDISMIKSWLLSHKPSSPKKQSVINKERDRSIAFVKSDFNPLYISDYKELFALSQGKKIVKLNGSKVLSLVEFSKIIIPSEIIKLRKKISRGVKLYASEFEGFVDVFVYKNGKYKDSLSLKIR